MIINIISLLSLITWVTPVDISNNQYVKELINLKRAYFYMKWNVVDNSTVLNLSSNNESIMDLSLQEQNKMVLTILDTNSITRVYTRKIAPMNNEQLQIDVVISQDGIRIDIDCFHVFDFPSRLFIFESHNPVNLTMNLDDNVHAFMTNSEPIQAYKCERYNKSQYSLHEREYIKYKDGQDAKDAGTIIVHLSDRRRDKTRTCRKHGVTLSIAEQVTFKNMCKKCTCHRSGMKCKSIICPDVSKCAQIVKNEMDCCPECADSCKYEGLERKHAEIFWTRDCSKCICKNGVLTCSREKDNGCPVLDCPTWRQVKKDGQCCPTCSSHLTCRTDSDCSQNGHCLPTVAGRSCACKIGFVSNGGICEDINECLFDENAKAQLGGCSPGSTCINEAGSFKCICPNGAVEQYGFCRIAV